MADTRLIQSRYRLLDLIGRGGMGEVWRARDESLGRLVAVKCLKPMGPQHDRAFTRVLRERFRREARVAASLQHRGITVVHDPYTVISRREVAVALVWLGRRPDALTAYRQVAEARGRVLGPDHPETLAARHDEAHCLDRLGRTEEAAGLYRTLAAHRAQNALPPH
ncbi:Serine/threonine-protein kinase PknD [Streptomyces microflavus]